MKRVVLVADDEPYVREVIKAMVMEAGDFEVVEAENGKELIDYARKVKPDLIIADVIMPDIDAYNAIGDLRKEEEFRKIPVIFDSGLMKDKIVFDTLKPTGPCAFLTKPFKYDELVEVLEELLGDIKDKKQ